jgi:hypothetical protein
VRLSPVVRQPTRPGVGSSPACRVRPPRDPREVTRALAGGELPPRGFAGCGGIGAPGGLPRRSGPQPARPVGHAAAPAHRLPGPDRTGGAAAAATGRPRPAPARRLHGPGPPARSPRTGTGTGTARLLAGPSRLFFPAQERKAPAPHRPAPAPPRRGPIACAAGPVRLRPRRRALRPECVCAAVEAAAAAAHQAAAPARQAATAARQAARLQAAAAAAPLTSCGAGRGCGSTVYMPSRPDARRAGPPGSAARLVKRVPNRQTGIVRSGKEGSE